MRDTAWGLVALASSVVGLALVTPLGAHLQCLPRQSPVKPTYLPARDWTFSPTYTQDLLSASAEDWIVPNHQSPVSIFKLLALQAGQVGASGVPDIVVKGITLSRYTHTINALLVAALFWMGAISFRKVLAPDLVPYQAQFRLQAHASAMQEQRSSGVFMHAGAQCKE